MLTLFRRCEPAVGVPPVRGKTLTAIGFLSGLICPSPALSVWAGSYGKAGSLPPGSSNQTSGPVGFTISVFPMAASAVFCALLQNPLCRFPAAAAASEGSDPCAAVLPSYLGFTLSRHLKRQLQIRRLDKLPPIGSPRCFAKQNSPRCQVASDLPCHDI